MENLNTNDTTTGADSRRSSPASGSEVRRPVRPAWCPEKACQFLSSIGGGAACVGRLPEKRPHGEGWNTHSLCIGNACPEDPACEPFRLEIHRSDAWGFQRLLEKVREDNPQNNEATHD